MAGSGTSGGHGQGSPVRRPSPAVYRRRRLVALSLVVLVLASIVAAGFWIASLLGPAPEDASTDVAGPAAPSSPAASPAASAGCEDSDVVVRAETDAAAYGSGENPTLILEVANKGKSPCEVNVGTDAMEFVVTSGDDRIFSSADCQVDPEPLMMTLEPGKKEQARFTWERNRTAPGCTSVEAKPQPGTYVLTTKLDKKSSKKTVFELR
ncbi:hypothetical protein E4J89_08055 [Arthrobacter sp. CAU 1506]|uniref:hypothetical protein n=1 Tax=Arthrobacter sp. CAU 1506 TaxID=2560052 RepID=UPI0010AD50C4|nr:hypothetical protein [Arthrobacter sp. CAU 1506]TJY70120.1 hypothetical protein E4J89_08055 [Arthrobacter sp. CAU 1506]